MAAPLRGVDRATAITLSEARQLKAAGFDWCGVYIGGITLAPSARSWTPHVVADLATIGLTFLPIYVGQNNPWTGDASFTTQNGQADGEDTIAILTAWGWVGRPDLPPGDPGRPTVALDLEAGSDDAPGFTDYAVRWANVVRQAGYNPVLYALIHGLGRYWPVNQGWTGCWATWWYSDKQFRPSLQTSQIPNLGTMFNGDDERGWQYTGGTVVVPGLSDFDLSIADFPLNPAPGEVKVIQPATSQQFATGHTMAGGFYQYWLKHGGIRVFGMPITDEIEIPAPGVDDSKYGVAAGKLRVQYTERWRFEWHPGVVPDDFDVQGGLIGAELLKIESSLAGAKDYLHQLNDALTQIGA